MDSHALARWAATTSATLVLIKIVERWRALRQIDASVALSSTSKLGNKVYLHNVTDRPIIITHWRIYMASGLRHQRDVKEIDRAESGANRITIAPLSSHVLFFFDENHFNGSAEFLDGRRLYIEICIAGKWTRTLSLLPCKDPLLDFFSRKLHRGRK